MPYYTFYVDTNTSKIGRKTTYRGCPIRTCLPGYDHRCRIKDLPCKGDLRHRPSWCTLRVTVDVTEELHDFEDLDNYLDGKLNANKEDWLDE